MRFAAIAAVCALLCACGTGGETRKGPAIAACVGQMEASVGALSGAPATVEQKGAVQAYCGCSVDQAAAIFTPEEFDLFARSLVAFHEGKPLPIEEAQRIASPEGRVREQQVQTKVLEVCAPLARALPGMRP